MLSASLAFHRLFADNPADLRVKATLTLADATLLNLEGEDFMEGGFSFSQASSTESAFVIGAATVGGFDCTLNNIDGKFDEYDFTGAEIVPYVGVELAPGNVEWLCKGRFWVEQPDSYGNTIGLSCVDNMTLLEKPYSDVNTIYPASIQSIVTNICTACGIMFATPDFPNKTYVVETRPDDGSLTCLQVISYVAQLACSWACVDTNGRLALRWYRTDWMDDERWLDGGTYDTTTTPYSDGDTADGGSFHSGGANVDGGSFDVVPSYALLQDIYDLTISTDDVVITGVKVTATGDDNTDGESSLYGTDGYVLEVAGNPLVLLGKASAVASMVGSLVVGMRFRPFSARADVDPTVEAGDPVMFADTKGNYYKSFFTSCAWSVTGGSQAACNAETPARNSAATYSAVTAAIVANRKALRHEVTAREAAIQNLQQIIETSSGLYKTEQVQPDQSVIYYLHDKPTLAQSTIVWKFTASAFAVSVDGGQTYPFGFDAWGNAILNSIYAIGINADYIDAGALTVRDAGNNIIFRASVEDHFTNIGGLYAADGSLYNDSLSLDAAGLYFYSTNGQNVKQQVGGLWPGRLVDDQGNLYGQLELRVPANFNIRSFFPYQGDSSSAYIFRYDKASDEMTFTATDMYAYADNLSFRGHSTDLYTDVKGLHLVGSSTSHNKIGDFNVTASGLDSRNGSNTGIAIESSNRRVMIYNGVHATTGMPNLFNVYSNGFQVRNNLYEARFHSAELTFRKVKYDDSHSIVRDYSSPALSVNQSILLIESAETSSGGGAASEHIGSLGLTGNTGYIRMVSSSDLGLAMVGDMKITVATGVDSDGYVTGGTTYTGQTFDLGSFKFTNGFLTSANAVSGTGGYSIDPGALLMLGSLSNELQLRGSEINLYGDMKTNYDVYSNKCLRIKGELRVYESESVGWSLGETTTINVYTGSGAYRNLTFKNGILTGH